VIDVVLRLGVRELTMSAISRGVGSDNRMVPMPRTCPRRTRARFREGVPAAS
jgi:hypothetical protein